MNRLKKETHIGKGDIHASYKIKKDESPMHCHDFFEIEYFADGRGEHTLDGAKSTIMPGMLYFMTPLNFHGFKTEDSRIYNVMFSERLCDMNFISRLIDNTQTLSVRVQGEDKVFLESVFSELCSCGNESYSMYLLNTILGKLITLKKTDEKSVSEISQSLVYITEHFRDSLTLHEVACHAGFTPTYFSALFKKEVGVSFKEYLDRLRFGYAKKLVEHTDKSISRICVESGFCDYPNFIRRFKRHFGVSPGKMRVN